MSNLRFNSYDTLDDIMNAVFEDLLELPCDLVSTRGTTSEIIGASFHLKNPRARLSRTETKGKLFSALGELLWYLSGSNELDFIKYYIKRYEKESDDEVTIYGAYGPRLFNLRGEFNQILNITSILREKPTSRKAVIQLFDGQDLIGNHKEFPCTCTLQFFIRQSKLHMHTCMRSNDAVVGLPHDIFAFTMLQEIVSNSLGIELGEYYHSVGSLHLYDYSIKSAKQYLNEGFQSTVQVMPPMPKKDPWLDLEKVTKIESDIRNNLSFDLQSSGLDLFWIDLLRLVEIYSLFKRNMFDEILLLQKDINPIYNPNIDRKLSVDRNNGG